MIVRVVQCLLGWKLNLLFQSFTIRARFLGKGQPGQQKTHLRSASRENTKIKDPNSIVLFMFSNGFLQVSILVFYVFFGGKCQGSRPCGGSYSTCW